MQVKFLNRLRVSEIARVDKFGAEIYWQTDDPFYVQITDEGLDKTIELVIPQYMTSDFCSVPKIPFAYLMYGGIGNRAGLVHDALYSPWPAIQACDLFTREPFLINRDWADQVLYAALIACYIPSWKARAMWLGVRAMGWKYFHCKPAFEQGVPHHDPY